MSAPGIASPGAAPGAASGPPGPPATGGEAGMLLLEALIWVALLAMLAVMIGNGASLTTRAWSSAERQSNDVDEMETARSYLRRTLAAAQPALVSPDPSDSRIAFEGRPDRLTLVAPRSGQRQAGEWLLQSMFVAPHDGGSALILAWQGDTRGIGADSPQAPLLDAVRSVRFGYFGPPAGGGQAGWQADWRNRDRLPDLIRMTVERDPAAGGDWPELLVATRVQGNAACRFEPGSSGCRRDRP